jgi:hypothetical protein
MVKRVVSGLRVTKVVCTRSVKGRTGDHYVGFSAAWDSTQDDGGGAAGLISTQGTEDEGLSVSVAGLTLREAKVAALILGMQVDRAAHLNAGAGGSITPEAQSDALRSINLNYCKLLASIIGEDDPEQPLPSPPVGG